MAKIIKKITNSAHEIKHEFIKQLLSLTTSGFGLVAALAWNEVIKEVVEIYIKPLAGKYSGLVSLIIYAVIVTALAVLVTFNLSRLSKKN